MVGRIVRAADFQRVLAVRPKSRSAHFAAHHLPDWPSRPGQGLKRPSNPKLSTGAVPSCPPLVDDLPVQAYGAGLAPLTSQVLAHGVSSLSAPMDSTAPPVPDVPAVEPKAAAAVSVDSAHDNLAAVDGCWLGLVVPKRYAKRSATRNLIKRQVRALVVEWSDRLAPGLWVVRLKSGFDALQYPSATSQALRRQAREELVQLFQRAALSTAAPAQPGAKAPA